jgi:hypothetical protein
MGPRPPGERLSKGKAESTGEKQKVESRKQKLNREDGKTGSSPVK